MIIIVLFFSIFVFFKTVSYGLYEIKNNQNNYGGIFVIEQATIILLLPTYMVYNRYSHLNQYNKATKHI